MFLNINHVSQSLPLTDISMVFNNGLPNPLFPSHVYRPFIVASTLLIRREPEGDIFTADVESLEI